MTDKRNGHIEAALQIIVSLGLPSAQQVNKNNCLIPC